MLEVLYSEATGELELSGTRQDLRLLGRLLSAPAGTCDLAENREPAPYDRSLARISFREDPAGGAAAIVAEGTVLRISGGRDALDLLAADIEDFAEESELSHHLHVDFPTCDFIASGSDPLVVAFLR
ncbi:Imm32 family immunity protein [Kitasatospora camelliae]|uniref:Uncharacterized protein n=1 Tax=Kitasatospora camelliae TaxID=3156397 RepID=A0AAU8K424_9ACTN